jgi:PAS domain S-box-containing protein
MNPDDTKWPPPRKLATGYTVAIAALVIDLLLTFWNLNSISRIWDALALSHDVVVGLDDVLSNLREAETGQRGYLLTGDERYLEPYTKSHALVAASIDRLRPLVANNVLRREHLSRAAEAASAKLSELEQTIRLRRESGFDAALTVVNTDRGRASMDQVRSEIAAMGAEEHATRVRLRDGLVAALKGTTLTFSFTSVLALVLLFGIHLLSQRSRGQLERHAAWLATTLRSMGDAVIATDREGRVTFLNPAAETLTGWARDEASGKPLEHIFRITNQITGEPVENPVTRVLREGIVVGLANHTKLTAKDGTIHPIDDTAAPITNNGGRIQGVVLVVHDVSERYAAEESMRESTRARRSAEAALREAEDARPVLAAIVQSSDDAIIGETLDGLITSWNQAAQRILGYTAAEIVGKPISTLLPPDHSEDMSQILERIRRGERVGHFETQRLAKDGRVIDVSLSVSPIRDADGTIIGAAKVARDFTERKRAEAEREQLLAATEAAKADAEAAKADAEAANRMKDDFLATLSHELRTPLNAIVGWAKILRSGKVDAEDVEEGLSAIDRNSHAQSQIIEDLLDISRIVSGNLRLDVQRLTLTDILDAALASVLPAANAKEIRIHKVFDSLVGPVTGDPARLQQVVWNLLANAVKFTPKGGTVHVLLERVNSHVEISVIDSGIGIKPEFLPHVFDRFRQADGSTTRLHAGLGLGLAIAKHLVEMHGGSIRAKSPGEGQGATFTLALPITVVHPDQPDRVKVRPRESDAIDDVCQDSALAGLKVLVVDDEPDARQLLRRALADCQAQVAVASSAAEALALIEIFQPDVIVCDIGMPEQDGYDLIHRVRANPATKDIPAAALTAFARPEDRKRSLLAGFQTHVAKPVDPAELTAVVASLAFRTGKGDKHQGG